jgi:hypothetical protein
MLNYCYEQEISPSGVTPRTSSRSNRFSADLEPEIRFEEPPLSSSSSSGHQGSQQQQQQQQQQKQHRSKQSRSTSNSKNSEEKSQNKTDDARYE